MLHQPDLYLSQLLNQRQALNLQVGAWLAELRDHAADQVQQLAIPTKRDEEWRFTDLSSLQQVAFQAPSERVVVAGLSLSRLLPEAVHSRLVFVNGEYAPELSSLRNLPAGVFAGSLAQLPSDYQGSIPAYLGQHSSSGEVFTALNTASFMDVAVIWVPQNKAVEQPIHLLFISRQWGNCDSSPLFGSR